MPTNCLQYNLFRYQKINLGIGVSGVTAQPRLLWKRVNYNSSLAQIRASSR